MEVNSQADEPPPSPTRWSANFLGTAIAAFTLVMPLSVTAYYSQPDLPAEPFQINRNYSQSP